MGYNNKTGRHILLLLICFLTVLSGTISGQSDKKYIRQGNSQYKENKFSESEIAYRKAIDKNKLSTDAAFNLGDALYRQNKYDEAGKQFLDNSSSVTDNTKKSAGFYNLGNSLLNSKKVEESIQAYKNSLKLDPANIQAKYNLAYAQDLLKQQQQQQQQDQKDKENNKEDKKEDQKKDQNKEQKQDQNKNQKEEKQQQQQQQQQQGISKEDAQRLLNAIANDEKNVQEKVKLEKAAKERVRTLINW